MTLALELRVDPLLDGGEPQLLEPADLGRRERLEREVGQRVAPPESERVAQRGWATRRIEPARLADEPREAAEVDRICLDLEHVPGVPSTDELRTEELPERRDGVLQGRGRGTRRLLAPDRADEELRRDDLAGPEEQDGQDRPVLLPAERQRLAVVGDDLERAEQPEFRHKTVVTARARDYEGR